MENIAYLVGSTGIAFLLSLSACGSCDGMSMCGTSSTLYSRTKIILTYSYVAMIMASTVFFYAFILAIIMINQIDDDYGLERALNHLCAGIVFGGVGFASGRSMGKISQHGFRRIAQKGSFFMSFIIAIASAEVILVIGFLCSLLIIYKK